VVTSCDCIAIDLRRREIESWAWCPSRMSASGSRSMQHSHVSNYAAELYKFIFIYPSLSIPCLTIVLYSIKAQYRIQVFFYSFATAYR